MHLTTATKKTLEKGPQGYMVENVRVQSLNNEGPLQYISGIKTSFHLGFKDFN